MIDLIGVKQINDDLIQEFDLVKGDLLYKCLFNNEKIGYAIIREKRNDKIFLVIGKNNQNKGYGSIIFKLLLSKIKGSVMCLVPLENIKMQRIVPKHNGIEMGRNGNSIQYIIENYE